MAPLIKYPYDFYKVITFKWHVSKSEPNQIISLQISYLNEASVFKTMEKIYILCVDKALISDGKILFKQSNALIIVIRTLFRRKQRLRGGMLTLNAVVKTQTMLNAQVTHIRQLSRKTQKDSTNSFWPIVNWSYGT